jgi:molybdate transport system substrate-binding protein
MRFATRKYKSIVFLITIIFIVAFGLTNLNFQSQASPEILVVFAGAAATPVYYDAADLFEAKNGIKVELRLDGSGSVLSAMKITRTGDLFIPGSPEYFIEAKKSGVINPNSVHPTILAYLVPAIIVQKDNPKNINSLEDLTKPGISIGIGDPESVCVGIYAKEILEQNNLWETVSPNIVNYAQSCSATAALIPTGAVDVIIGWHVFKNWTPYKADIIWITPDKIPQISYIAGAVSVFSENKILAQRFLDFLTSEEVNEIWSKYGYFASKQKAKIHAPDAKIELVS